MLTANEFFDLSRFAHRELFPEDGEVWTALDGLKGYLARQFRHPWPLRGICGMVERAIAIHDGRVCRDLEPGVGTDGAPLGFQNGEPLTGAALILPGAYLADDRIVLGAGTVVEPGAYLRGPLVVGCDSEIRQGAYIRGNCVIGDGCVVGHTTEIKGSILLDRAKAGHFAYIGDSILGNGVNLGAGTKLANLKIVAGPIAIAAGQSRFETGRRKLGAVLGDRTETGCNAVTSPGTLMGPGSIVYPAVAVPGGYYPARTIIRHAENSVRIGSVRP